MSLVIPPPPTVAVPVGGDGGLPVHRIYCVGRNYAEHAQEMGFSGREPPFFFMKPADAVVPVADGETGAIAYPSLTTEPAPRGRTGGGHRPSAGATSRRPTPPTSGVTRSGLDMTRRDLQGEMKKQGRPWCIGKAFEQSAPIGPIVPDRAHGGCTAPRRDHAGRQRPAAPARRPVGADLERRRDHRAPERGLDAAARRPDLHRHARRGRRGGAGDMMEAASTGLGALRLRGRERSAERREQRTEGATHGAVQLLSVRRPRTGCASRSR
jgi:hypothetical protein